MQAHAEIDYNDNIIKITSLPWNGMTNTVISKILALRKTGKIFTEIVGFKNYTTEDVDLQIILKKDANPEKVLNQLYKKNTGLRDTLPVNIYIIDDYQKKGYGVRKLLLEWIDYRRDTVRAMLLNRLQNMTEKYHMNEVLILVSSDENRKDTVEIASKSKNKSEQIEKYMVRYKISSLQAQVVADMRTSGFTKDAFQRYKDNKKKYKEIINEIEYYLKSNETIDEYIIKELEEMKAKYGTPRRCKVVKIKNEAEDSIPEYECLVGISEDGFIKKIPYKEGITIGNVGNNSNIVVMKLNNVEDILAIDEFGKVSRVLLSSVPDSKFEDSGIDMHKLFDVKGSIKGTLELPNTRVLSNKNKEYQLVFITKNGYAKKVELPEFKRISGSTIGIKLDGDDKLAASLFTTENSKDDIVICTNKGNGIRLSISEIRKYSKSAKGLPMMLLMKDEEITQASLIDTKKKYLLYVTSSGKMKLTDIKLFPRMERKDDVLMLIKLSRNENLVGIGTVNMDDKVLIYKNHSEPEEISVKDIPIKARLSSGEKLVSMNKDEVVVSYKIFK